MFAVRQWPGNGADLDFRGVLEGCTAAIVAAAPIEGTLLKDGDATDEGMNTHSARKAFLKSDEYAAVAKVLPFCRLWCVRAGWRLPPLCDLSATQPVQQSRTLTRPPTAHLFGSGCGAPHWGTLPEYLAPCCPCVCWPVLAPKWIPAAHRKYPGTIFHRDSLTPFDIRRFVKLSLKLPNPF